MRIIDANVLQDQYIAKMEEVVKSTSTPNISLEALNLLCGYTLIMDAPTIEQCRYWDNENNFCGLYRPAAIKHGRWIKRGDNSWECSVCHEISCCNGNYCVDCGAKMDEVEE